MPIETHKKKLKSGAELEVWLATFADGHRLFKAVTKEIQDLDMQNDTVQKLSMRLLSSDAIENALWPCIDKATYNGLRLTPQMFEDIAVRRDFLEIQKEVLEFNLSPFSENVGSLSKAIFQVNTDILK